MSKIREELDDHLLSINENTNEVQTNYEYLCELDSRIEKLTQRVEDMYLFLEKSLKKPDGFSDVFNISPLSRKEQEVFLALYTAGSLTFPELALKLRCPEFAVKRYVANLLRKGIPIIKQNLGGILRIAIDTHFKELQAKENILEINASVMEKLA